MLEHLIINIRNVISKISSKMCEEGGASENSPAKIDLILLTLAFEIVKFYYNCNVLIVNIITSSFANLFVRHLVLLVSYGVSAVF